MFDFFNFLIISFLIGSVFNYFLRADGYRGPKSDHFDGKRFFNHPSGRHFNSHENRFTEFFIFAFKKMDSKVWKRRSLPGSLTTPEERVFGSKIVATFINHSTVLIQTEGLNILTDPVWSNRASPFPYFGPRRWVPPGIEIDKLPKIDLILLSHNHYDHMDLGALKKIVAKDAPTIFTTLGNSNYLQKKGVPGAFDMDWGDSRTFSDAISIDCVPAQHFSARAISDRDKTLWAGFVIHSAHGDIYFAGDTGYGSCISHIKKMYPDGFRLAFLPIGAYEPLSFMREVHENPDEAVEVAKELQVRHFVPIHFGTFDLALDGQDDPQNRLKELLAREENKTIGCNLLENGQHLVLD